MVSSTKCYNERKERWKGKLQIETKAKCVWGVGGEGRRPQRNGGQTLWIELNEGFFRAKYYPVGAPKHGAQSGDQPKPYPVEP